MIKKNMVRAVSCCVLWSASAIARAPEADLDGAYRRGVADAAIVEESEIAKDLITVSRDNKDLIWSEDGTRVLVATWKAQGAYEKFLKPYDRTSDQEDYAVWVTTVPQVQQFCRQYLGGNGGAGKERLDLRLKQYLGLNHTWNYDVFVEMWVKPDDLFRPCVDPEVGDTQCDLQFGEKAPVVKNIASYRDFYRNLYYKSFRASTGVPWTGLGYTYDWGNPASHKGASEYILAPGAEYTIKGAVPTMQYCGS